LLVPQVRLSRRRKIEEQCGTLRILDFSRPIELGDLYVDVNILNEPTGYKHLEISDLPKIYNPDTDEVDRFALGEVHQPRVPGMNVIKNYSKLMILGKPGAGKSTFLQHLAIQCNQGGLLADRVVIFIRLKTFAENAHSIKDFSLLQFISQELNGDCEFVDQTKTIELLAYGRAFILMDGLDEVSQEDSDRVVNQLSDFFEKYHRNKFVVTCRIAAQQYRFTGFTYVEVADFNQEQIEDFSEKFFIAVDKSSNKSRLTNTIKFREELRKSENSQIREISVTPILLTLTCLVFLSKAQFPTNRAQLYQDGIEILLLKWDGSRLILREDRDNIYKKLSISQKIDLLTYVASLTFEKNFYFLRKEELKGYIIDFLNQLEEIDNKPLKNNLGESVLKSIEVQHGLLIERAQNIYSFSHLTFQEYFTARKYINPDLFEDLATYVVEEKRWREVFLLSTDLIEKVDKADELIWIVKLKIDKMIASDSSLQDFLCWIKEKSGLLNSGNRSFYLSLIIAYYSRLEKSLNDRSEKSFRVERLLRLDEALVSKSNQSFLNKEKSLMSALSLSVILMKSSIECNLDEEKILIRERTLVLIKFFDEIAIWLPVIRNIARQFPNQSSSRSVFVNWWTNDGKKLISSLRKMMIEHYNLGHDWGFSENQIENLKRYYSANEYLKSLLINVNHISSTMRSKIHETIMLPMVDIQ
jgi:predicted NACHT family NTPase